MLQWAPDNVWLSCKGQVEKDPKFHCRSDRPGLTCVDTVDKAAVGWAGLQLLTDPLIPQPNGGVVPCFPWAPDGAMIADIVAECGTDASSKQVRIVRVDLSGGP